MDKEERELQIRLAQLNAKLQINIAWTFGVSASSLVLFIYGLQSFKEDFTGSVIFLIASFVFMFCALVYAHKAWSCLDRFEEIQ